VLTIPVFIPRVDIHRLAFNQSFNIYVAYLMFSDGFAQQNSYTKVKCHCSH
jgi:hypothetical protein